MTTDIQWFRRMLATLLYGAGSTGLRFDALHVALQTKGFHDLTQATLEAQLSYLAVAEKAEQVDNPLGGKQNWRLTKAGERWVEKQGWI